MPNKQSSSDTLPTVLAKAQSELKKAAKSADNPYFKSKYAGLDEVIEASRNILNKHGIAVTQTVECVPEKTERGEEGAALINTPQQTYLVTTLLYGDQSIRSVIPLDYKRGDMQSFGSAMTYAKRYGLSSICCLSTEDSLDDDGNKAVGEEKVAAKVNKRSNYRKPASIAEAATKVTSADQFLPEGKV
tara:strand:+ start:39 stop:602 length:564 start_codon:yes stop_codon:yes gene_type:complete